MSKPSIPQGTRDFSPEVVLRRRYIFETLQKIFELYGYQPIETPAMEQLATLTGKYGDEGDRLIFKILNNGLYEKKEQDKIKLQNDFEVLLNKNTSLPTITERALRYDLTIPFARYVVMNQNELALPFKRYQMQPVWRADRPQRGRYREFWQCDCDVVGSNALTNEAELLAIYAQAFEQLAIPGISIKINSRKILAGMATYCGYPEKMIDITVALDKLDKIGWEGVHKALSNLDIDDKGIGKLEQVIAITGTNDEKLIKLSQLFKDTPEAMQGIAELTNTLEYYKNLRQKDGPAKVVIDTALARGLNYYTGVIMEVTTSAVSMGSIGGGGRYDDLTGLFGLKNLSGVGMSFGIDRIYDVMDELKLFPENLGFQNFVLILNLGVKEQAYGLNLLAQLRAENIASEMYPDITKMDKQLKYANKRKMKYVIIIGEEEMQTGAVSLKNFVSGVQQQMSVTTLIQTLKTTC